MTVQPEVPEYDMMCFERNTVDTPSGRISFLQSGAENEKTVLFLHGIAGNARSFRRQCFKEFRVVAWDAPGYGETTAVPKPSMDSYAKAVRNLLDALGILRIHTIVGHSMGGIVAQAFVGLYPDRVEKLVISSSYSGDAMSVPSPLAAKWIDRLNDLECMPPEKFGEARARGMLVENVSETIRKEVASIASEVTIDGLKGGCTLLHTADTRLFAQKFQLPVLVVIGDKDKVIVPEKTTKLAELIPNSQTVRLNGVAHAAYLEVPDLYNETLIKFMDT